MIPRCSNELSCWQYAGSEAALVYSSRIDYSLCCICRYYYRLSALLCLTIYYTRLSYLLCSALHSTIRCTMPVDITTDYPIPRQSALLCLAIYYNRVSAVLFSFWRYYVQPTIRSALPADITTNFPLCSVWRYSTPDYPICSTLLCLATLRSTILCTMPVDITTDNPLSRLSAVLCLAILLPTILFTRLYLLIIQSTDYPLCSVWRYYKRLSAVLYFVC
jgi:hypothetical protein